MLQAGDSQSRPYNDLGVLPFFLLGNNFSLLCWFYVYGEQPQNEGRDSGWGELQAIHHSHPALEI